MKIPKVKTAKQMNAWFRKLSPANKRVAIATDVLDQIKARRIKIERGGWVDVLPLTQDNLLFPSAPVCNVCALGAAMMSSVRLSNTGDIDDTTDNDDIVNQLDEQFTVNQLNLIEAVFEMRAECGDRASGVFLSDPENGLDLDQIHKAKQFSRKYKNNTSRAIAIFKNIIANKGEFKP